MSRKSRIESLLALAAGIVGALLLVALFALGGNESSKPVYASERPNVTVNQPLPPVDGTEVLTTGTQLHDGLAVTVYYTVTLKVSPDQPALEYSSDFKKGICQIKGRHVSIPDLWLVVCASSDYLQIDEGWMSRRDFWMAAIGLQPVDWTMKPWPLVGQNVLVRNGTVVFDSTLPNRQVKWTLNNPVICSVPATVGYDAQGQWQYIKIACPNGVLGWVERQSLRLGYPGELPYDFWLRLKPDFDRVYVRSGPSTSAEIIGSVTRPDVDYGILGAQQVPPRTWFKIHNPELGWSEGWVAGEFFDKKLSPNASPSPVVHPPLMIAQAGRADYRINVRNDANGARVIGKIIGQARSYEVIESRFGWIHLLNSHYVVGSAEEGWMDGWAATQFFAVVAQER